MKHSAGEQFICKVYAQPRQTAACHNAADLRWLFYSKKQAKEQNNPPTPPALRPAIQRSLPMHGMI